MSHKKEVKKWRAFEESVCQFAKSLDPTARVIFNHRIIDADTRKARQVDVWLEARLASHYPVNVVISCKDYIRRLDVSKIETFASEIRSLRATMGIIYSSSGFTQGALAKAAALGVVCCRLYRDEPADMPQLILFPAFLCKLRIGVHVMEVAESCPFRTWGELLNSHYPENGEQAFIDIIAEDVYKQERIEVDRVAQRKFPSDFKIGYSLQGIRGTTIRLRIECYWARYRGKLEAYLVNGSYTCSNPQFLGSQAGPVVDTQGSHPGEGWEEINEQMDLPEQMIMCYLMGGNVRDGLLGHLGSRPIEVVGPHSPARNPTSRE